MSAEEAEKRFAAIRELVIASNDAAIWQLRTLIDLIGRAAGMSEAEIQSATVQESDGRARSEVHHAD